MRSQNNPGDIFQQKTMIKKYVHLQAAIFNTQNSPLKLIEYFKIYIISLSDKLRMSKNGIHSAGIFYDKDMVLNIAKNGVTESCIYASS